MFSVEQAYINIKNKSSFLMYSVSCSLWQFLILFCEVSALSTYIEYVDIILHPGPLDFIIQFVAQSAEI